MTTLTSSHPLSSLQEILQTVTAGLPPTPATRSYSSTRRTSRTTAPVTPQPTGKTAPAEPQDSTSATTEPETYALYIAMDWADDHHDVCVLDPTTQQRTHRQVPHSPTALHPWLLAIHQRAAGQPVAIAVEQTTGALVACLLEYDWIKVYPVNPVTLAQYRHALHVSGAKDDPTDADLLLDLLTLHRHHLRRLTPDTPLTRTLQRLTHTRRQAVNHRTRFSNQLTDLLKQYYPLFLEVCGEDLFAPMACELLLAYPYFDALKQADPDTLRHFYIQHGCWKPEVIADRLARIRDAEPLTTDAALIQPAILEATLLANLLLTVGQSIAGYDKTIADLFPQHEDAPIFDSFPGAGPVLAPRLLVAFGTQRERFETATAVQNTVGISPIRRASRTISFIKWRPACSKFLRQSFHEYANESIRQSIWARAYYQMQRERGKGHHAAIRALAFKWIRILFRCWQAREPYDELRYLAALQRHHAPLLDYLSKSDQMLGPQPIASARNNRRSTAR